MAMEIGIETTLELRLHSSVKEAVEQAAAHMGQSVDEFAVSALAHTAREVIEHRGVTLLTARDWERFLAQLDEPAEANTAEGCRPEVQANCAESATVAKGAGVRATVPCPGPGRWIGMRLAQERKARRGWRERERIETAWDRSGLADRRLHPFDSAKSDYLAWGLVFAPSLRSLRLCARPLNRCAPDAVGRVGLGPRPDRSHPSPNYSDPARPGKMQGS
jgi:uncharacterized protein (DUF1778 family)